MTTDPIETISTDAAADTFRRQLDAMTAGDTKQLDPLLAEDFTLTHITGYIQPKGEWLEEVRAGKFDYHHIEVRQINVEPVAGGAEPTVILASRVVADATVYGTRAYWRLLLTQTYSPTPTGWIATASVATTW